MHLWGFLKKGGEKPPSPKFYRCITCGNLFGPEMLSRGTCAGHRVQYATNGTVWEFLKIKLGFIK